MANAIRLLTIERGINPRDYSLVAFGGAGPLHACGVAEAVGIRRVIVPPHPGLCSAFGAAIAQLRVDRVRSLGVRSDTIDEGELRRQLRAMEAAARAELEQDGLRDEPIVRRCVDARYYMQNYEHEVELGELVTGFLARGCAAFHGLHRDHYGYAFDSEPIELVNCKVTATERQPPPAAEAYGASYGEAEPAGTRSVVGSDGFAAGVTVLRRGRLTGPLPGPLVVEEVDSTVFVATGWTIESGPRETYLLERTEQP